MKCKKLMALLILSLILLAYITPSAVAESNDNETPRRQTIIDRFRVWVFEKTYRTLIGMVPWAGLRLSEPKMFVAEPSEVDLEYLKTTKIEIGIKNESNGGGWELIQNVRPVSPLFPVEDYQFDVQLPDDVPKEYFSYVFSPQQVYSTEEGELKTTLTIIPNVPKDAELPKTLIIRVNVSKFQTAGFVYLPAPPTKDPNTNWIRWLIQAPTWFIASVSGENPFGVKYSGKRSYDSPSTYVDIIVKVNRYHLVSIEPPKQIDMKADDMISVPLEIENLGSHIDTYNFKVSLNEGSDLTISVPTAITLDSNEKGKTLLSVASPPRFDDPGTLHKITIKTYSIYDPDQEIYNTTVAIYTKGIYVSEIGALYFAGLIFIILIMAAYIIRRRKKVLALFCKKPEKQRREQPVQKIKKQQEKQKPKK